MAPSKQKLEALLRSGVEQMFQQDRDSLTVKKVRERVEKEAGLDPGFFSKEDWKDKSKTFIKSYAEELVKAEEAEVQDAPEPTPKKAAPAPKKGMKRSSDNVKGRPTKRQKKAATPSDEDLTEASESPAEETEESELGDSDDSDAPKRKTTKKTKAVTVAKRGSRSKTKVDSEDDEEILSEDFTDSDVPKIKKKSLPKKKTPVKRQAGKKVEVVSEDDEEEVTPAVADSEDDPREAEPPKSAKRATPKKSTPKKATPKIESHKPQFIKAPESDEEKSKPEPVVDNASDSEMSVVIDEGPKPKRKRKSDSNSAPSSKNKASKGEKPAKVTKTKTPAAAKDLSPDELQIKTLQSHLTKCGIKKIWQFELKQYGDDSKAKIKHLSNALKDIGMTGRFSEARAKEIKEQRELMADLEAVKEGEKSWGLESGRRASRKLTKKSFKEVSDEEDEDVKGSGLEEVKKKTRSASTEDDEDEDEQAPARKPRAARAALAFLADSDEDSD